MCESEHSINAWQRFCVRKHLSDITIFHFDNNKVWKWYKIRADLHAFNHYFNLPIPPKSLWTWYERWRQSCWAWMRNVQKEDDSSASVTKVERPTSLKEAWDKQNAWSRIHQTLWSEPPAVASPNIPTALCQAQSGPKNTCQLHGETVIVCGLNSSTFWNPTDR